MELDESWGERPIFMCVLLFVRRGHSNTHCVVFLGSDIGGFRKRGGIYVCLQAHDGQRDLAESAVLLAGW